METLRKSLSMETMIKKFIFPFILKLSKDGIQKRQKIKTQVEMTLNFQA